jgi:hypothetical protein
MFVFVAYRDVLFHELDIFLLQALRVSMEEQRQRQEEEARRAQVASAADGSTPAPTPIKEGTESA